MYNILEGFIMMHFADIFSDVDLLLRNDLQRDTARDVRRLAE
jgi:hypothetical protein